MSANVSTCVFCVMDSTNPTIQFDVAGQCNCCRDALSRKPHEWWPGEEGKNRLAELVRRLKEKGRDRPYDAMVGLSGGIDSAYLAHLMSAEHGLRLLAVHVDGGWNSEPAVRNIESIVRGLDLDLHTYVVEWQEMRDVQLAFLRASVVNQDIPQDHAFFSTLYRTAVKFGIRDFLSGVNFASENVTAPGWGHPSIDGTHLRAIHRRFGVLPLSTFPVMPFTEYLWLTRVRRQLSVHRPLDFLAYDKAAAQAELRSRYGWRDYGGKHHESRFTKFYEQVYLPRKYGFDKRRLHLSSLIVSGQLTRQAALEELAVTSVDDVQRARDTRFVAKKLGIPATELEDLLARPPIPHSAYPSQLRIHRALATARSALRTLTGSRSAGGGS